MRTKAEQQGAEDVAQVGLELGFRGVGAQEGPQHRPRRRDALCGSTEAVDRLVEDVDVGHAAAAAEAAKERLGRKHDSSDPRRPLRDRLVLRGLQLPPKHRDGGSGVA